MVCICLNLLLSVVYYGFKIGKGVDYFIVMGVFFSLCKYF